VTGNRFKLLQKISISQTPNYFLFFKVTQKEKRGKEKHRLGAVKL